MSQRFRLAKVTHDHVLRVASWFIITSGYLLSSHGYQSIAAVRHPTSVIFTSAPDLGNLFTAGAVLLFAMVAVDLVRCPPPKGPMRYLVLFEVTLMWLGLPAIGLVLGMMPALYAQTRLMFGQPITYKVTPRKASRSAA